MQPDMRLVGALGKMLLWAALYHVPSVIAAVRGHKNWVEIVLINELLGWTILGWWVALVWACMNPVRVVMVPPGQQQQFAGSGRGQKRADRWSRRWGRRHA